MAIKILYLIDKLVPAGTQTNLLEVVKRLDRNRFEPKVIALTGGGGLAQEFKDAGVELIVLRAGKVYSPSGLRALSFLIRYMKEEKIVIVQTHFLHADILGTLAAKFAGVPKIITTRRDEGFWRGKRQLSLNRFFNRFVDKILVNSEAVRDAVLRSEHVRSRKIHRIYNGVDPSTYFPSEELRKEMRETLGIKEGESIVGMIAHMRHEVKGHRFLIKAMSAVQKEIPNVRLLLVGDGPLRASFERYAVRHGMLDRISFLGARRDIPAVINAMDVVCVPSLSEGFSNAILESMAVAKPVVATNVGGNPELVLDSETGFLVRPRHAGAIAEKILFLLREEHMRAQMGAAGQERIRTQFTVEKMAQEYEAFYAGLLRGGPREGGQEKRIRALRRTPRAPLRMMHIIWSLEVGGAEQVVMDLVRRLDKRNFEPVVCCLNEKGRFACRVEQEGIKVIALHKKPKFDLLLVPRLVRLIKKGKIKLIHTHLFTANLWGRMAAKLAGVPVISSEHGMDVWRTPLHLILDRLLTRVSKRIVFVSEVVKSFYSVRNHSLNGKSRVIHNGIDFVRFQERLDPSALRRSLGFGEREKVVGIVGRLVPEKAHVGFIEAIKLLLEEAKDIRGLIVGEGELLGKLKERVRELHLEDHIIFAGHRDDLPKLYQAMDVFVMASLREGFPLTLLEAMAAGLPVVATEVGGITELIKHGEDGLLVPCGDVFALARSISRILGDHELKERLIQNAREKVRAHFSVEKMVKDYESLYAEVLSL